MKYYLPIGMDKAVRYQLLHISSEAFENRGMIPSKYTCDGLNVHPPLRIENIPEETKCLVVIVDDPDAPVRPWTHWLAWNIPVTHHLKEEEIHGIEGLNDFEQVHYAGPCPPSGTHRYFFKIYGLDALLNLPAHTRKEGLEKAMSAHIIAFGELMGLYAKMDHKE